MSFLLLLRLVIKSLWPESAAIKLLFFLLFSLLFEFLIVMFRDQENLDKRNIFSITKKLLSLLFGKLGAFFWDLWFLLYSNFLVLGLMRACSLDLLYWSNTLDSVDVKVFKVSENSAMSTLSEVEVIILVKTKSLDSIISWVLSGLISLIFLFLIFLRRISFPINSLDTCEVKKQNLGCSPANTTHFFASYESPEILAKLLI